MESNHPAANRGNQRKIAGSPAALYGPGFITAAPLRDVLFDQLEYLTAHSGQDCSPDCLDCSRLEHVKSWLLLPFHCTMHRA